MVIFSILAIELLSGSLRGYCYFDPRPGRNSFTPSALSRLLAQQTPFLAEQYNVLGARKVVVQTCRPDEESAFGAGSGFACPKMAVDGVMYNTTCSTKRWCGGDWCDKDWNGNPWDDGGGYISYDNILSALLTNFQCLTLASWNDVLYRTSNGSNVWLSRLYHTAWVLIGAFVVVQLARAVLAEAFVQVGTRGLACKRAEWQRMRCMLTLSTRIRSRSGLDLAKRCPCLAWGSVLQLPSEFRRQRLLKHFRWDPYSSEP